MSTLPTLLAPIITDQPSQEVFGYTDAVQAAVEAAGYDIVERNDQKPWGAYLRFNGNNADEFVRDFFTDLSPEDARLGNPDAELSPKLLIVSPGARLSLQTHERRAERWLFLTPGSYYKSLTDDPGELQHAQPGEIVQFARGETHRLCGNDAGFVLVAEIWQHSDPTQLSDEDDITRLHDDYSR